MTNPIIFEGEASKGEDAAKIGAGAGMGAVIGGPGGHGRSEGSAVGGAAGTGAVLVTKGKEVTVGGAHRGNARRTVRYPRPRHTIVDRARLLSGLDRPPGPTAVHPA